MSTGGLSAKMPRMARRRSVFSLSGRPLRVQLTVAFASVMSIVLAATGLLTYAKFSADFDVRTDRELQEREATIEHLASERRTPEAVIALAGEAYVQVYSADGSVLASSERLQGGRLLTAALARQATTRPVVGDHPVPGGGEGARVRAFPIHGQRAAAIGEPLEERSAELNGLALLLSVALPAALLLASAAGYFVARSALRPVERMRQQASTIGAGDLTQRLPVPGTRDELDRLAVTLNELLDRLAGALERERRMIGDASHELRTPISVLRTRIDGALRSDADEAELREVLQSTRCDARRLSHLADDLILLARADQGRLPLRPEPVELRTALDESVDRVATAEGTAPGALTVLPSAGDGAVALADPDRLGQALDNLLTNAVRYGRAPVEVDAAVLGNALQIRVRDRGDGFPEDFLPHALERFSQAQLTGAGSGLGLAIVDAVMRVQGGTVRVENAPGGGALATLTIPAA